MNKRIQFSKEEKNYISLIVNNTGFPEGDSDTSLNRLHERCVQKLMRWN